MYWSKVYYRLDDPWEKFQERLSRLIQIKQENTLRNHLFQSGEMNSDDAVRGMVKGTNFRFWIRNVTLRGIFYPVFKGRLIRFGNAEVLELRVHLNLMGGIVVSLMDAALLYYMVTEIIIQESNELYPLLFRSLLGLLLFFIFQTVPIIGFRIMKKEILENFEKEFKLTRVKVKKREQR